MNGPTPQHGPQSARRVLPAYGRELLEVRRRGMVPADQYGREVPVVVVLDNWRWARGRCRLVVTTDTSIDKIDWCVVAGLDTWLLFGTDHSRRDAALRGILRVAPRQLWAVDMINPERSYFVLSRLLGILRPEYLR